MNVLLLLLLAQAINLLAFVWVNRKIAVRLALYRRSSRSTGAARRSRD